MKSVYNVSPQVESTDKRREVKEALRGFGDERRWQRHE